MEKSNVISLRRARIRLGRRQFRGMLSGGPAKILRFPLPAADTAVKEKESDRGIASRGLRRARLDAADRRFGETDPLGNQRHAESGLLQVQDSLLP